jgi:hypothetical protein
MKLFRFKNLELLRQLAWKYQDDWVFGEYVWSIKDKEGGSPVLALWAGNGPSFFDTELRYGPKYVLQLGTIERWFAWSFMKYFQRELIRRKELS